MSIEYPDAETLGKSPYAQAMKKSNMADNEIGCVAPSRDSLADEHARAANFHKAQFVQREKAEVFFKDNPAFDEFIQLIRSGSISI